MNYKIRKETVMKEGLLWFDNDPKRNLADKIERAATRYQSKFNRNPTICYLNQADFDDKLEQVQGIDLRTATNVLRHHLWIGIEDKIAA
jgi:hypothetical protein